MSLNVAAGISAVLGVPLASVPVGLTIHSTVQSFRPKTKLKKWSIRIEQISSVIASKGEVITPEEMRDFLRKLKLWVKSISRRTIMITDFLYSTVIKTQGICFVNESQTVLAHGTEKVKGLLMTFPPTLAMLGTLDS